MPSVFMVHWKDSQASLKALTVTVTLYYRHWGLAEIGREKKYIGWSMGGVVLEVELPAVLSPWNQDSVTILTSMCPRMHKAWPAREVHELQCPEF